MRVIQQANTFFQTVIGRQEVSAATCYRPAAFVLLTEAEDGTPLAYNSLSGELLVPDAGELALLRMPEVPYVDAAKALIEKWFLVPLAQDDLSFAQETRALTKDLTPSAGLSSYTIYTTTDCNARCFYCYELRAKRLFMSEQTARDAAAFILRTHGDRKIHLLWYGGEPLYHASVIDIITDALIEAGADFESEMISNGYLLNAETADKICGKWKCKRVQITLDGTEEVYNKTKAYIYKDGQSAFAVVTEHIGLLLARGVRVAVRINLGAHNREDLYRLVDWLKERYPDKTGLYVYPFLLFDTDSFDPLRGTAAADIAALQQSRAADLLALERYCADAGLHAVGKLERSLRTHHCMMDAPDAVTILPDGKLGKCDHRLTDGFVGTIYDGVTEKEMLAALAEVWVEPSLCGACPAFPVCCRLAHCPAEGRTICNEAKRHIAVSKLEQRVKTAYRKAAGQSE